MRTCLSMFQDLFLEMQELSVFPDYHSLSDKTVEGFDYREMPLSRCLGGRLV